MKLYVNKMPKDKSECFLCQDGGICGMCGNPCVVEECCCLEQLVISVSDIEEPGTEAAAQEAEHEE